LKCSYTKCTIWDSYFVVYSLPVNLRSSTFNIILRVSYQASPHIKLGVDLNSYRVPKLNSCENVRIFWQPQKQSISWHIPSCKQHKVIFAFGGGGGLPYKKDGGACRKFWKEPLRGIKNLSCGRCFFSPLSGTNSKSAHFMSYFFGSI